MKMEIYKNWKIEKADYGYYQATSLSNCDAYMKHSKSKEDIKKEIDEEGIDYKKITNIEIEGIDTNDYPDFVDAFISSADYEGVAMTEGELDEINEDGSFVYECVIDKVN